MASLAGNKKTSVIYFCIVRIHFVTSGRRAPEKLRPEMSIAVDRFGGAEVSTPFFGATRIGLISVD